MTPALAIIETSSIARGVIVVDAMVKKAPVRVLQNHPISPGKHLVVVTGGVAEVDEAMAAGKLAAKDLLLDHVQLAAAHDQIWPMLGAPVTPLDWAGDRDAEAVAIIETRTVCAAIAAADAACKVALVEVRDTRFAVDLAGKAYFTLTGTLDAIEAAAAAATAAASDRLVGLEVIAQPSPDLRGRLFR